MAITVVLTAALYGQNNDVRPGEAKGLAPRANPSDYQTQVKAGAYTIAAEFTGHSVATAESALTSEDYVAVEVGLFGQSGAHLKLSIEDFSLRINGRKQLYPAQPYATIFHSLKDPSWVPPTPPESKNKTSLGGNPSAADGPPPPVHMPFPLERAMQQSVQRAALPEGDRTLPVAGLMFFEFRGKEKSIRSVELVYTGPAGNATVALQ
ncbi:MAG: hypothetical protein ABSB15_07125 [Bryobacteraceae bacterium]